MIDKIKKWFASKGGVTHVTALVFAAAVGAYSDVPSFHSLVLKIWGMIPFGPRELMITAAGLYTWYRNSNKKPKEDPNAQQPESKPQA